MQMPRILGRYRFLLVLLIVSVCGFTIAYRVTQHQLAFAQLSVQPFVAEIWFYAHGPAMPQEGKLVSKMIKARKRDGANLSMTSIPILSMDTFGRRLVLPDGLVVYAVDSLQMKSSYRRPVDQIRAQRERLLNPPAGCVQRSVEHVVESTTLNGVSTSVIQHIDEHGRRWTHWRAPALACEDIAYQVEAQEAGLYRLVTRAVNISVEINDPDSALFDTGFGYAEGPPSGIETAIARKAGQSRSDCQGCVQSDAALDKYYLSHQQ